MPKDMPSKVGPKRRSQNTKQVKKSNKESQPQKTQPSSTAQEVIDEHFFIGLMKMSEADLKIKLDGLKARKEFLDNQIEQRNETFRKLVGEKAELDEKRIDKLASLNALKKKYQEVALSTVGLQEKYNDLIDPHNNINTMLAEDKAKYSQLVKRLNEYQKSKDAYAARLNQEAFEMDQKINNALNHRDEKNQQLEDTKQELMQQETVRDNILHVRQECEASVKAANVEGLLQNLNESKQAQEKKQKELEEICEKLKVSESEVEKTKQKKLEVEEKLSLKKKEVEEMKAHNDFYKNRIENEKKFIEEVVRSKFNKQSEDLENANLNVTALLREQIEKFNADETLISDLKLELQEKKKTIEDLKVIKFEKQQNKKSLEDQLDRVPKVDSQLLQKKKDLSEKVQEVKAKKVSNIRVHNDRVSNYERKIKKEQRKQTYLGFIDDEKTSMNKSSEEDAKDKTSDDSESQMSSSLAEIAGVGLLKKMSIDSSIVSSVFDSTIKKSNK